MQKYEKKTDDYIILSVFYFVVFLLREFVRKFSPLLTEMLSLCEASLLDWRTGYVRHPGLGISDTRVLVCLTPGSWHVRHPGLGMSDIRVLVCLTPGCQTRCSCIRGYV